jgi:hypothetical protein
VYTDKGAKVKQFRCLLSGFQISHKRTACKVLCVGSVHNLAWFFYRTVWDNLLVKTSTCESIQTFLNADSCTYISEKENDGHMKWHDKRYTNQLLHELCHRTRLKNFWLHTRLVQVTGELFCLSHLSAWDQTFFKRRLRSTVSRSASLDRTRRDLKEKLSDSVAAYVT